MAEWYVKDLSKLTKVSVQTLHYYDKISLLVPSVRLANGYRLYSEKDLLKLQQIIALKFFGFELSQIKILLQQKVNLIDHFAAQSELLQKKAEALLEADKTLNAVISSYDKNESIPWEVIIQLIEVYSMTQDLAKTWAGKILNKEELKDYAIFQQGLKTRYTLAEKESFEQNWANLVAQISSNLDTEPSSDFGIALGQRCMELVNDLYGKKHAALRSSIWEKGYKSGQMDEEHALSLDVVTWLDRAIDAYYRGRVYTILAEAERLSPNADRLWAELMNEMYGDSKEGKDAVITAAMQDDKVGPIARKWLKHRFKE